MGFKDYFSEHALDYAQYRPDYPPVLFKYLAEQTGSCNLAWDCATGNGQAAHGLARYFKRVVGTDASARQIQAARGTDSIEYRVATAEHSGLAAASVDLISVAQAAHWFDLPTFYAETQRVLRPAGLLVIWCYGLCRIEPAVDRVTDWFYNAVLGPYWAPERVLIDRAYSDIKLPFPELDKPRFEIRKNWNRNEYLAYLSTWSAVKRYQRSVAADVLEQLDSRLTAFWPEALESKVIRWPLYIRLGRKPDSVPGE